MNLTRRIEILTSVGREMADVCSNPEWHNFPGYKKLYESNPWFTEEFVKFSFSEWSEKLNPITIAEWIKPYNIPDSFQNLRLGLIMAGNIPMVGFHDLICGFLCGLKLNIKLSSKDELLMKWVLDRIIDKDPIFNERITISENRVTNFDAIIATGSNNTNRYFEYYFSTCPNILRKHRNSVAILDGSESFEELEALADDVFVYFGLGCRNISKIYLPQNYNFDNLGLAFQKYIHLKDHFRFANNLDYQYAVLSMNTIMHINLGNLFLEEIKELHAPVGIVNYEYYNDVENLKTMLEAKSDQLQCIVSHIDGISGSIPFGKTQRPNLNEYADNADTISFILNLKP